MDDEPKKSAADVGYAIAKAAVASVPIAGAAAAELLGLVFGPPLERRREEWLHQLADAVNELGQRVAELTPEGLSNNEVFVSTALRATEIAVRTHEREKLEALRNAVIGSALPDAPDETLQQIFLNHIETLTTWHVRILDFFNDPRRWIDLRGIVCPNWTMGSPAVVMERAFPELAGQRAFYDSLVSDLEQRALLSAGGIHTTMTAQGMFASRTTELGRRFLWFVSPK